MKMALAELAKNYEKEAQFSVSDGKLPEDEEEFHRPMFSLAQKKTNIEKLEDKAEILKSKIPKVQSIEFELGLPDNVEDSELVQAKKSIEKSLNNAREAVKKQKDAEKKA